MYFSTSYVFKIHNAAQIQTAFSALCIYMQHIYHMIVSISQLFFYFTTSVKKKMAEQQFNIEGNSLSSVVC